MIKEQLIKIIRDALHYRESNWQAAECADGVIVIDSTEGGGFVIEAKELAPPARVRAAQAQRRGADRPLPLAEDAWAAPAERIELAISPIAAGALEAPRLDDDEIPF